MIRRKEMNERFQLNRRLRREGYKGRQVAQRRAIKAQKAVNATAMPLRCITEVPEFIIPLLAAPTTVAVGVLLDVVVVVGEGLG